MNNDYSDWRQVDSILHARKLVRYGPSSLSLDDISNSIDLELINHDSSVKIPKREKVHFIPPKPLVSSVVTLSSSLPHNINNNNNNKMKSSRFSFLMNDLASSKKNEAIQPKSMKKMHYELPNIKKVQSLVKCQKPLMVVSLSVTDFQDDDDQITISSESLSSSIEISQEMFPEARQIDSPPQSSDSE